ncbi:hypothetical protein OS493_007723 [Desmophyllum pertusum]|uniref:JmjC domain-containing protein n=1 Tax=Desmophyllum pertusum TaxID=174260 RepID=A0A9W9YRM9_9CNID|nr:hypothetical protein OS493_007723 [Desmophyllum pertusum]
MATEKHKELELQKVTDAFRALRKKARELGIKDSQLSKITAVKSLQKKRPTCFVLTSAVFLLLGILCGVGLILYQQELLSHHALYKVAQNVIDFDMDKDICLIPYPEIVLDMFRPPVNCSMCKGVHRVDRASALSKQEFVQKYAYTSRPVVITDGTEDWTASQHFSFNYFKSIYGPESPVLLAEDQKCQFFPYQTNFKSLQDVFNMSDKDANMEGKPWYIGWSNCDSSAANELRKHYKMPYFLPDTSESSKTDWLFMGCPGYGANLHIDNVGNPSWQAQIKGTKKWTLEPPPECAHVCDPKLEVTVNSGEIIILDTNKWFHQTDIIGKELSITIGSEYD